MKAINCINVGHLVDGEFIIINHVLIYVDEKGNEYNTSFSEVRFRNKIESYQFNGESYRFLQQLFNAIFLNKVNEITNVSE